MDNPGTCQIYCGLRQWFVVTAICGPSDICMWIRIRFRSSRPTTLSNASRYRTGSCYFSFAFKKYVNKTDLKVIKVACCFGSTFILFDSEVKMPQSSRILCLQICLLIEGSGFLQNCLLIEGTGSNLTDEAKSGFRGPKLIQTRIRVRKTAYYTNTPIYYV